MKSLSYVALLRGINVGGNAIISMQDLKNAFGSLGFTNIRTILASGNVLFEACEEDRARLTRKIEQTLQKKFGVEIFVMIRTIGEIQALLESKPFKSTQITAQTKLHVSFLPFDLKHDLKASQRLHSTEFEVFRVSRGEVLQCRGNFPQSRDQRFDEGVGKTIRQGNHDPNVEHCGKNRKGSGDIEEGR